MSKIDDVARLSRSAQFLRDVALVVVMALGMHSNIARADHGRDFLLLETARLGAVGTKTAIARQDYVREETLNVYEFEPLLSWTARD